MSSSAINQGVLSAKISNVQNVGDSSAVCSTTGDWSFKNATATATNVFISNAGNVGVGTTSPGAKLEVWKDNVRIGNDVTSGIYGLQWWRAGSERGRVALDASASLLELQADGEMRFLTAGENERMRIDSTGRVILNNNTASGQAGVITANGITGRAGISGALSNTYNINWTGSAQLWIDSTNVGTIAFTSDYRVKKNVETQELRALERIAQLRPVKYEFANYGELFKEDGIQREGFIAHELQAIIPSAVEGDKDATDQIQSLKLDALCSVMVKAIQELSAKNEALEARLAALESKP